MTESTWYVDHMWTRNREVLLKSLGKEKCCCILLRMPLRGERIDRVYASRRFPVAWDGAVDDDEESCVPLSTIVE